MTDADAGALIVAGFIASPFLFALAATGAVAVAEWVSDRFPMR